MQGKENWRLQHYMALCSVASRRASEEIISEGRVSVNGEVVTVPGTKVSSQDVVCVDGKKIQFESQKRYILLNKPSGYVCSNADEKGRSQASDILKEAFTERLYNVGRLDMFSEGAILFTNDGDFASRLSHPSAELEKEYIVDTYKPLPRNLAEDFTHGVRVEGIFYRCKICEELNSRRMRIVLIEGKNREIRRVFESYEVPIKRLERIRIGNVGLGKLKSGEFRELSKSEVESLLRLCKQNEY